MVVLTDVLLPLQLELNAYCHEHSICLITADAMGVLGHVFCDFGDNFVVLDTNGEQPQSALIMAIDQVCPL